MTKRHTPVLLEESINYLDVHSNKNYIDATLGEGSHTREILKENSPKGKVLGIDRDKDMLAKAKEHLEEFKERVVFKQSSFSDISEIVSDLDLDFSGILFDLGMSMVHIKDSGRGFSFHESDEELDMRYDTDNTDVTAKDILNNKNKEELSKIFKEYGEEKHSKRIAKHIVEQRKKKSIEKVGRLVELVKEAGENTPNLHPATKVFQALRIAVNSELEEVEKTLESLPDISSNNFRVVVITFHSLESKLVTNYFRSFQSDGLGEIVTDKPIKPSKEEIKNNPASRSAQLRVFKFYE